MTTDQLRQALRELKGDRSCVLAVSGLPESHALVTVHNAMLVPDEADHLIKLTDGQSIFAIDAERVVFIRIGHSKGLASHG